MNNVVGIARAIGRQENSIVFRLSGADHNSIWSSPMLRATPSPLFKHHSNNESQRTIDAEGIPSILSYREKEENHPALGSALLVLLSSPRSRLSALGFADFFAAIALTSSVYQ
jgi:hypothetical protein